MADAVVARFRQGKAQRVAFGGEEFVRELHEYPGAVAHQRIGADRPAMREVLQNLQALGDDIVRAPALQVGDEADAA